MYGSSGFGMSRIVVEIDQSGWRAGSEERIDHVSRARCSGRAEEFVTWSHAASGRAAPRASSRSVPSKRARGRRDRSSCITKQQRCGRRRLERALIAPSRWSEHVVARQARSRTGTRARPGQTLPWPPPSRATTRMASAPLAARCSIMSRKNALDAGRHTRACSRCVGRSRVVLLHQRQILRDSGIEPATATYRAAWGITVKTLEGSVGARLALSSATVGSTERRSSPCRAPGPRRPPARPARPSSIPCSTASATRRS